MWLEKIRMFSMSIFQNKVRILPLLLFLIMVICTGCDNRMQRIKENSELSVKENKEINQNKDSEKEISQEDQWEKGYNLPIEDEKKTKAETECLNVADIISDIYKNADKGNDSNVVLSDETLERMQETIGRYGYSVVTSEVYCTMCNYEQIDQFLRDCVNGKAGSAVLYSLSDSGAVSRKEYTFDGSDMYILFTGARWNNSSDPIVSYVSYTRINEWSYTEKGWFFYELCVPEPPEVTEIIDGSEMVRVIPLSDEYKTLSEKCVYPLCYMGNNILCSNWNAENLSTIDFNAAYEYFYNMKCGERLDPGKCINGIPAAEFEDVIMEYLPVTEEELRKWAVYDEKTQTYAWAKLGCGNYNLSYFGTSLPEVTGVKENKDGTAVLTVEAVCDRGTVSDAVITHELTIQFNEDGRFQYLGNKILNDGIKKIPEYQYRISRE